jgi:diguanylate cyclase (GGDEF)-like protein
MEVTQEIVLPVLLAAIVANTVILVLVVVVMRLGRRDRMSSTRSALEGSLMSSSFVDQTGRSSWRSAGAERNASVADADVVASDADSLAGDPGAAGAVGTVPADAADANADLDESSDPDNDGEAAVPERVLPPGATTGVDPLTGLLDDQAFTRAVAAEDLRIHRYKAPATVVIFELDGLDRLVERLGSDAADRIMPALADTTRRLAREVDQVARIAPGRFAVLLPETDEVAAINYVERVRRACELWLESGAIALRLAAGWAGTAGDPTLPGAIRLATDRMYVELRRGARRAADR